MSGFPDNITNLLSRALKVRLDRHQLLTANVANADTPGYTPLDMRFSHVLDAAASTGPLKTTAEQHLPGMELQGSAPMLVYDPSSQPGLDGNSVSLDREMARVAENAIAYNATVRALQKKLALLRYAASEGGT